MINLNGLNIIQGPNKIREDYNQQKNQQFKGVSVCKE